MRELLSATDPVLISFIEATLREHGLEAVLLDRNMSVLEGSLGILPCRILVTAEAWPEACRILKDAGLGRWLTAQETA